MTNLIAVILKIIVSVVTVQEPAWSESQPRCLSSCGEGGIPVSDGWMWPRQPTQLEQKKVEKTYEIRTAHFTLEGREYGVELDRRLLKTRTGTKRIREEWEWEETEEPEPITWADVNSTIATLAGGTSNTMDHITNVIRQP